MKITYLRLSLFKSENLVFETFFIKNHGFVGIHAFHFLKTFKKYIKNLFSEQKVAFFEFEKQNHVKTQKIQKYAFHNLMLFSLFKK